MSDISEETLKGLCEAYKRWLTDPPYGSTTRDRLEDWIEQVLLEAGKLEEVRRLLEEKTRERREGLL